MKKLLLALGLCAVAATAAQAQNKEIFVSYGGFTQMDATNMHPLDHDTDNAWGALNVGMNFRAGSNFWIGPSYTFSSQNYKGKGWDDSHAYYHVIMLNARYNYYHTGNLTMYAKAGAGLDITHANKADGHKGRTSSYFAFQVNPVGAAYSLSDNFDLFGEVGFGAQGLLQVGFKYKF